MTKKEVMEILLSYRDAMREVAACEEEFRMAETDEDFRAAAASRLALAKDRASASRERIERAADILLEKRHSVIVRMRYVHLVKETARKPCRLRRWRDIAAVVHYGVSTVKRTHTEAVRLLMNYETL